MTENDILAKIVGIVSRQFSVNKAEIRAETGPEEIEAWDSLSHVSLTTELETAFRMNFEIDEIMEMEDVGSIAKVIKRKQAA